MHFSNIDYPAGIRGQRFIQEQPIVIGDVRVWYRDARVNTRRCMEGLHHCSNVIVADCASGGTSGDRDMIAVLLQNALGTLCDLESVCAHVKANMGFELVKIICEIYKCVQQGSYGIDDIAKARLKDYMRWIQASMTSLVANLDMNVPATLAEQPLKSSARLDYHSLTRVPNRWIKMGVSDNFSPCISIFTVS